MENKVAASFGICLPPIEAKSDKQASPVGFGAVNLKQLTPNTVQTQLNLLIESKQQNSKTIAERAKHEAQILQRISQLRKEGLWSIKRLPKLVEPQRVKTHWDFLLDEMVQPLNTK